MSGPVLAVVHAGEASRQAITAARRLGAPLEAAAFTTDETTLAGEHGARKVHQVEHELLTDYAPEAHGEALRQLVGLVDPVAVVGPGTERGNEVMAHLAARLDLPFVANCTVVSPGDPWTVTRVRWGGSLLEETELDTDAPRLVSIAPHAVAAEPAPAEPEVVAFRPELDAALARTRVVAREEAAKGVTLTTAPVVVSGGRGVGSPEGFAVLEELAAMLGGAVGCSRVATNNGWRPHSDQVGQTGTRIAPELYVACGISGAIQHWVGCMASKRILAINTDPEANMVRKADYAVIGDLHEVLGAVVAELRGREA